jgi:FPC/CPF motif-containing protein YcgG
VDWFPEVYEAFAARMLSRSEDYPCHFGVQGQQRGHNWFSVFDERSPGRYDIPALAGTLRAFQHRARTGPTRQSLVVFAGPPEPVATLAAHHERFWRILADLSFVDSSQWPDGFAADPAHPRWQWCFGGEPWFVFACSPAYRRRRSRDVGPCLTLVLQTARVFEGIGGSTVAGKAAKRLVRQRLARFDSVPVHPHLGDPRMSSEHKWRQYALPDDSTVLAPDRCPISGSGSVRSSS